MKSLIWGLLSLCFFFSLNANAENMCSSVSTSAASGSLFDSGGSGSNYQSYEDCTFLIQPSGASSVTLTFSDFSLESGYDYVYLYDGANTSAPLVATLTGTGALSYTANSGTMLVRFRSDYSIVDRGFSATWTAVTSSCSAQSVGDNFPSISYSQNSGSVNWIGNWTEVGESDGASAGIARVRSDLCTSGNCLRLGVPSGNSAQTFSNRGVSREADLSGATGAMLSFDYRRGVNQGSQTVVLSVSNNGGSSWTNLQSYFISSTNTSVVSASFDISAYATSNTQIRFLASGNNSVVGMYIDNINISYQPTCSTALPAPLAEWRLDESSWSASADEIKDYSGNGFHGVASESMNTNVNGVVCRAIDLSVKDTVTTDYISLDAAAFDGLNEFSFSVWGKSSETGSQALLSGFGPDYGNELLLWFDRSDYFQPLVKSDSFSMGSNGFSILDFASPANRDSWHHFVYTRKADKNCLYIDGALQGCKYGVATGALRFLPGSVIIGQEQDAFAGGFDISQDWDGWIDEPTLFESELSLAQVSAIYANQAAGKNYDGSERRCGLPPPVVDYRFDSCNWADARDVVDSGPNSLDAYAVNGVVSTVGGQICGLAQFDSVDDYVWLPDINLVDFSSEMTAMAWIKLDSTPTELKSIISKDTNYEVHIDSNRQVYWWWIDADNVTRSFASGSSISLGQWQHVAISYRDGFQVIYIDGQEVARQTYVGQLLTNSNDLQIGQDHGIATRFFDGDIDEVKLFDVALTPFEIEDIVANEVAGRNYDGALRSCNCTAPVSLDHYAISHDQSMVSCLTEDITFTAHDNADLAVDAKDALLQISTSTSKGEWLSVVNGSGVLNNLGNGQASYQFPDNGETSVTLRLSYPDLASDPELLNFNVTDGVSTDKRNASDLEDKDLSVSDSGLVFSIPDTESCQSSVLVSIKAVKKSDNSLSCSSAVAGNQTVNFYSQYLAPSSGSQALILNAGGTDYPLLTPSPGSAVPMVFNAQGEASMTVKYPDAGRVGLSAELTVGQKTLLGSDSFVVYPAQLSVMAETSAGVALDNNSVAGGAVWPAARPFTLKVSGQCSTGTVTSNYQPSNAELGTSLHTPTQAAGGVSGGLTVSAGNLAVNDAVGWLNISTGFSNGVFEDLSARYSEVGIINLYAKDQNYYGHAISQTVAPVGRFIPWSFGVTANSPIWETHCSSGDFSYMSEEIEYQTSPELVVTSFNAVGGRVYNYGGPLWKLSAQLGDRFYTDQSTAVSATLNSTVDASLGTWGGTETDYDGAAINTLAADSIIYTRNALEAPFNGLTDLTLTMADLTDTEGACYRVDSDADGDWLEESCSAFTISNIPAKELRFGRLRLADAYGPETEPLPFPWVAEYYNGSDFIINTTDSCSAWLASEVTYSDNDGALIASVQTAATYAYPGADFRVEAGDAGVIMSAPGAGNTGVVGVVVDLTRMPYFFFDWDGDGSFDDAPSANIIYGQYRSNDRVIYQRQW